LFKFGVAVAVATVGAGVDSGEDTSFDKICCDFGVNSAIDFCPAFFPTLRMMFKAVSTTCFLQIDHHKKSLSFEKIPDPPT